MDFTGPPPGTEHLPEGRPSRPGIPGTARIPRPAASRPPAPRAGRVPPRPAPAVRSPRPPARRRSLAGELVMISVSWFGVGVPAAFVTQIWAGSGFSPGQGGGFPELITWVVIFGAVTIAMVAERHLNTRENDIAEIARTGALGGAVLGVILAFVWFALKNGPAPGNWFVGPCCASAGAAFLLYAVRSHRRR